MTGLLVSVRSSGEARLALEGGADVIDLKEPAHGALGAAEPAVWAEVASTVAARVPMSVALGEMREADEPTYPHALTEFQFAKLGLAGCRTWPDWPRRWAERLQILPTGVAPVAVVYADWSLAASPRPEAILEQAAEGRCGVVLFDTFCKTNGGLLHHLELTELARLTHLARGWGMQVVLAGSLGPATIRQTLALAPDYIAVRGAACRGARTGDVDVNMVRGLRRLIRENPRSGRLLDVHASGTNRDTTARGIDHE
jgi:uncharacterized protein (UPF0264 family)